MKKYLVHYATGRFTSTATIIEVEDDYVPASDDMMLLKKKVVEQDKPNRESLYSAPDACGGGVNCVDGNPIPANKLNILGVSNLNV